MEAQLLVLNLQQFQFGTLITTKSLLLLIGQVIILEHGKNQILNNIKEILKFAALVDFYYL